MLIDHQKNETAQHLLPGQQHMRLKNGHCIWNKQLKLFDRFFVYKVFQIRGHTVFHFHFCRYENEKCGSIMFHVSSQRWFFEVVAYRKTQNPRLSPTHLLTIRIYFSKAEDAARDHHSEEVTKLNWSSVNQVIVFVQSYSRSKSNATHSPTIYVIVHPFTAFPLT